MDLLFSLIEVHIASTFVGDHDWYMVDHSDILIGMLHCNYGVGHLLWHSVECRISLLDEPHGRSIGTLPEGLVKRRYCII